MSPLGTFRRLLEERMPTVFRGHYGSRFVASIGIGLDSVYQMCLDAWKAPLQQRSDGPAYDALQLLGSETSITQLAGEGWVSYENRLQDPWETWSVAGTEYGLEQQLTLSLFQDAQIFPYDANGSASEFVVFLPAGSHPVTGPGSTVGSFTVGDGTIVGPDGLDPGQLQSLKTMVLHWKPAQWKCPLVIFELDGWTVGTGHTTGESGLVIGGSHATSRIQ